MATRTVEDEIDRQKLIRFIQEQKLPFTASVEAGKKRSTEQNKLQRLWVNEIADQFPEHSAEQWRGFCKLHHGVPIMRNADADFAEVYDRIIRPLPYEAKLELMQVPIDMPVTSLMKVKQKQQYLDAVWTDFSSRGAVLTEPPDRQGHDQSEAA